jgi:PIN domain nuclease of toxin-antitoxin system
MNESLPHSVVLDTHAWLWLDAADPRIRKPKVLEAIEGARARGGVLVSAISVWEVALLESKQRIVLHQDCHLWVRTALAAPGVILQPLSPEIAVESTRLPGDFHGDPADRILVATSRVLNAPLVTADRQILAYGERKHVRTLEI